MKDKGLRIVLVVGLLLTLMAVGTVEARGPGRVSALALPSLSSGFQLQNISTTETANVTIDYYDSNGDLVETDTDSIGPQSAKSFYVPTVLSQPDGRYSVVVSSNVLLNCLVNQVTSGGGSPYVAATHSGVKGELETGSPMYIPWAVSNYYGYNSMIAIQNAGTAIATLHADFYQSGQSTPYKQYNQSVKAGGSWYLDLSQSPYSTDLPPASSKGFYGSVKIYSDGDAIPVAAVLNDTNPTYSFLRSYNGIKTSATKLYGPQVTANYYGYSSGITLQNPNASSVSAHIAYYPSGVITPAAVQDVTIPANSALPIYLPSVSGMPTDFNGTAVVEVTAGGPIMGIANHDHVPAGPAASYNLVSEDEAATTLYLPQVVRAYAGFESGWQVYNIGPADVTIEVKYYRQGETTPTWTQTESIPAYSAFTMYLGDSRGASLGTNFTGGAVIAVTSGNGKLVGLGNFVAPQTGDNMQVYNAFH